MNKSHLVGQSLNSIHDARTHVYKKNYVLPLRRKEVEAFDVTKLSLCLAFQLSNFEQISEIGRT